MTFPFFLFRFISAFGKTHPQQHRGKPRTVTFTRFTLHQHTVHHGYWHMQKLLLYVVNRSIPDVFLCRQPGSTPPLPVNLSLWLCHGWVLCSQTTWRHTTTYMTHSIHVNSIVKCLTTFELDETIRQTHYRHCVSVVCVKHGLFLLEPCSSNQYMDDDVMCMLWLPLEDHQQPILFIIH